MIVLAAAAGAYVLSAVIVAVVPAPPGSSISSRPVLRDRREIEAEGDAALAGPRVAPAALGRS